MYPIDWQQVSEWWSNLNTGMQLLLGGLTAYTSGRGSWTLAAQVFRLGRWAVTTFRAWIARPSRIAVVEDRLTSLLVKLGETPSVMGSPSKIGPPNQDRR